MDKYYLQANNRDQESYSILYGRGSLFLDRHKQYTLFLDQNRKKLSEDETFLLEYSLGVRDVLGLFDKPYIQTYPTKSSRFQVFSDNKRTSFLNFEKRKIASLPNWEFHYDIDDELYLFNSQKKIILEQTSNKNILISQALKYFPNSFLITFDTELIKLLRSSNVELGIIRKKENYTCLKGNKIDRAPCKSLFGNEKFDYLSNNECYVRCKYLRDIQNSKNFKVSAMRPYTFLSQVLKDDYTPRCLMILDKGFFNSLKSYFSFFSTIQNTKKVEYFRFIKNVLDNKIFKLKDYEKKGWMNLIEQLRCTAPRDERFPSFNKNLYRGESKEALFHYLKKKGFESIDGLTSEDFSKYCDLKIDIFKINLALRSKKPYFIKQGIHTPRSTEHIWKNLISKYAKYFLIL